MQSITIIGAAICLAVLYLRYTAGKQNPPQRRKVKQIFKTAKVLGAAMLAWLAISLQLRQLNHSLSDRTPYEMTLWDRVVTTLSK